MILRTRFGDRELRTEFGSSRIPAPGSGGLSAAGLPVTMEAAYGLPAVSNVIRSPAEIIASLPFIVYERGPERERAEDSWQWRLLHERPSEESDSFQFVHDLVLSLEATQNAFVEKVKSGREVVELYVLDPQRVSVRRDPKTREKLYDVWVSPSQVERDLTGDRILHVRGFSPQPGAVAGVSLLHQHRDPIGAALAVQRFEGDYFRNSARAPLIFVIPQGIQQPDKQAEQMLDYWDARHQGAGNQFRVGAVWGGVDVRPVPISLEDALFADAKRMSIEDACRIWRWPRQLLELPGEQGATDENAWTARLLKFYVLPRLRRIERALAADRDLFAGSRLFGEFLTAGLERADIKTRYEAYLKARQAGWRTANEIRRDENAPPHPDGDQLQQTPVGGAPNTDGGEQQEAA